VTHTPGSGVKAETPRFILSDPTPSEACYFAGFAPRLAHGDAAVLKAQEWAHIRNGRDVSLSSMAAAAGLERRTFLRRFAKATGMTPIEYCRAVRVARARELLEFGNLPQKLIAQSLRYKDVASFARVFRNATGWRQEPTEKRSALILCRLTMDLGGRDREHSSHPSDGHRGALRRENQDVFTSSNCTRFRRQAPTITRRRRSRRASAPAFRSRNSRLHCTSILLWLIRDRAFGRQRVPMSATPPTDGVIGRPACG
jgi:AraC-like DNA-binding protein